MIVTSYSEARAHLAGLMDKVTQDAEEVRITRRGKPDVVLIAADELEGLKETAYLLRSPANAARLLEGLAEAERGEGIVLRADTVRAMRREIARGATYDEAEARAGITEETASAVRGHRGPGT